MPDDSRQHDHSPMDSPVRQGTVQQGTVQQGTLNGSSPPKAPEPLSIEPETLGKADALNISEMGGSPAPANQGSFVSASSIHAGAERNDSQVIHEPTDAKGTVPRQEGQTLSGHHSRETVTATGSLPEATALVRATTLSMDRAPIVSPADPDARDQSKSRRRSHHADPLTQSLTLLATIAVMLLAARFVVPRIVEEVRYAWHRGELRAEYESGTEGLKNVSLDALSEAYQMVTAAVGPSVVHIDVERQALSEDASMAHLLSGSDVPTTDQGSGVVVDADGFVLTNRHVISDGNEITVTLSDGRRVPAKVAGTDALTDLALLKIDAQGLMPITWGDSDRCKVGAPVWAVGSPFGLDRTVTFGILSGKHRMVRASTQYQDFMQSDVAVNPGNSGGPLIDARGTLIGINTAIVGDTYRGVSFSIPSNVAKQVYQQLRESGEVERGWLGVKLDEVAYDPASGGDPLLRGALVDYVTDPDSPAAKAGLQSGDLILSVDEQPIENMAHLMRLIGGTMAGSQVRLHILRDTQPLDIPVVLGARPPELNRR